MNIGINLLFLIPNKVGGSETFVRGMIEGIRKYDKENSYVIFCNRENFHTFKPDKNIQLVETPINAQNKLLRLVYEQMVFPFFVKKYNLDLLHSIGYISPFWLPTKSIVNIIDLNWYYHPEDFSKFELFVWKFMVVNSARFADAISTISLSSKKSIEKVLKVNKPVEVICMGEPPVVKPAHKSELIKLGVNFPYIFSLTSAHPHKNILGLLRSFKLVVENGYDLNLMIAGLGGRSSAEVSEFIKTNSLDKRVNILGYVSNSVMFGLYKFAKAFVFTSRYEGFGIPILEAFNAGLPVISSDSFSLKEVVGNGGIILKPDDHKGFAEEIVKVLSDEKYYKKLSKLSKARDKVYNWKNEIEKLVKFYKTVYED